MDGIPTSISLKDVSIHRPFTELSSALLMFASGRGKNGTKIVSTEQFYAFGLFDRARQFQHCSSLWTSLPRAGSRRLGSS